MSALADQQLAKLRMWVPMGGVYFATCLLLAGRLVTGGELYAQPPDTSAVVFPGEQS